MTIASSPSPSISRAPGRDVGACARHGAVVLTHVVVQRAAAAGTSAHHHLDAEPGQQADGGFVDLRRQHLLGAAGQQRHAGAALALRRMDAAASHRAAGGKLRGRQRQHRPQPSRRTVREPGSAGQDGRSTRAAQSQCGTAPGAAARCPARRAAAARARAGGRSARCRSARDRPGACSSRRTGTWSCRTGRTGSDRRGAPPPRWRGGRSPACP